MRKTKLRYEFQHRVREAASGCVVWTSTTQPSGHGVVNLKGRLYRVHRVVWEDINGPIPTGMFVLHKCDNPPCVNVDHLFLGTQSDNANDRHNKGRTAHGNTSGKTKIADDDLEDIFQMREEGWLHRQIADYYGVDTSTITRILHKERVALR